MRCSCRWAPMGSAAAAAVTTSIASRRRHRRAADSQARPTTVTDTDASPIDRTPAALPRPSPARIGHSQPPRTARCGIQAEVDEEDEDRLAERGVLDEDLRAAEEHDGGRDDRPPVAHAEPAHHPVQQWAAREAQQVLHGDREREVRAQPVHDLQEDRIAGEPQRVVEGAGARVVDVDGRVGKADEPGAPAEPEGSPAAGSRPARSRRATGSPDGGPARQSRPVAWPATTGRPQPIVPAAAARRCLTR